MVLKTVMIINNYDMFNKKMHLSLLFLLAIFLFIIVSYLIKKNIESNRLDTYSVGEILEYKKSKISVHDVVYTFHDVNGNLYMGTKVEGTYLYNCVIDQTCIGKHYQVYYEKNNPKNCVLLLDNYIKYENDE